MSPYDENAVRILAITPSPGSAQRLRELFDRTRWVVAFAADCREARRQLEQIHPGVVLCEANLDDGNWREVLAKARALADPPKVIVTSNKADERLWTEVLAEGAYDLLPRPFESDELFRVVSLAWRDWWHHHHGAARTASA